MSAPATTTTSRHRPDLAAEDMAAGSTLRQALLSEQVSRPDRSFPTDARAKPARPEDGTAAAPRAVLSGDLDLDHVRRARDVHQRAGRDHDPVARSHEAVRPHGVQGARPELLDV